MNSPDANKIAEHFSAILEEIGCDLNAEGIRETPLRAARALVEMTEGSRMETDQLTKMFKAECHAAICHDMVVVEGIREVGLCEHHLLPILEPAERHLFWSAPPPLRSAGALQEVGDDMHSVATCISLSSGA